MRNLASFAIAIVAVSITFSSANALAPQLINYQGFLRDTIPPKNPVNGLFDMTFTIYDSPTGMNVIWTEAQTGVNVNVGEFNVLLGSISTLLDTVFNDTTRYLGIKIGTDPEFTPRTRLVSVPYSFKSTGSHFAENADLLDSLNSTDFATTDHSHSPVSTGWVDEGLVVRLETLSDNVGIGTASPVEKLHVVGNVLTTGTAEVSGFQMVTGAINGHVLTSDGSGTGTWQAPVASNIDSIPPFPYQIQFHSNIFHFQRQLTPSVSIPDPLITVPADSTLYVTGITVGSVQGAQGIITRDATTILYFQHSPSQGVSVFNWTSGGGAPLLFESGQILGVQNFSGINFEITVVGYQF